MVPSAAASDRQPPDPRQSLRRILLTGGVTAALAGAAATAVQLYGERWFATEMANGAAENGPLAQKTPFASQPVAIHAVTDRDAWPNLFGPTHDNAAPLGESFRISLNATPREVWRVPCGQGYSSPILWKNRLILLDRVGNEEIISCRDTTDGDVLWEFRYPTAFVCGSHYTHGPYSTPAADGERVYALGAEGWLHCLRLDTGELLWKRQLRDEFQVEPDVFGAGHSPLLWGDRLILNVGGTTPDSGVIAFNKRTGDILWQATDHGPSYSTPQPARIHGRDRLFVLTKQGLVMLDPADGRVFWEMPYQSAVPEGYTAVTPVVHGDVVLVSIFGLGTRVIRIHPDDTFSELWESKRVMTSQYTPVLCADGCVYGMHSLDNSLRCVDLTSGELKWRWKSDLANSKHLIVGRHIVLFGEYGHLGLIDLNPDEVVERWMTAESLFGDQRCFSAPAWVDGRLYLRNEEFLVCVDLRDPNPEPEDAALANLQEPEPSAAAKR